MKNSNKNMQNYEGVNLGPTYFEGIMQKVQSEDGQEKIEWRAKLNVKCKKIIFYGKLRNVSDLDYPLITQNESVPQLVFASTIDNQEIILFDGCKHGYSSMFCDNFSSEEINKRHPNQVYPQCNRFEVIVSAYYQTDFDNNWLTKDDINNEGLIERVNDLPITVPELKRNAFDYFQILIKNDFNMFPILQEETA